MSGISTKKFAKEVLKLSGADEMELIRSNSHAIYEFRYKGMERGYRYAMPISASCHHAMKNAAKDIKRGLALLLANKNANATA